MKKIILLFMMLFLTTGVMQSQIKIGENTVPKKDAVLDLNGTVQGGLLLPNVNITDTARIPATFTDASVQNADNAPALAGMIVWNTNTVTGEGVYMWDGTKWNLLQDGDDPCGTPLTQDNPAAVSKNYGTTHTFSLGVATGGSGTITYNWQQSTNNSTWANASGTRNGQNYTTPALTANTYYRRQATDATCGSTVNSNSALITINASTTPVTVGSYKWAKSNLTGSGARGGTFVANVYNPGMFYQFNRSKGWASSGTVTGWNSTGDTGSSWVVGNDPCPAGYRVPTNAQLTNLNNQANAFVAKSNTVAGLGGQPGRIFGPGAKNTAFNAATQIFLPAAGSRVGDGSMSLPGEQGQYWSRDSYASNAKYKLGYGIGASTIGSSTPNYGFSVRCVAE